MNIYILAEGFGIGAGLIIAIGAQNAFVLKNGISKRNVFLTAFICSSIDIVLIILGAIGLGTVINKTPVIMQAAALFGIIYLTWFGIKSFTAVFKNQKFEDSENWKVQKGVKAKVITILALSLLNPHVYIDTVILLGSVASRYPLNERINFITGACSASILWFFGLSYGARILRPLFIKEITWKILDFIIGCVMFSIVFKLIFFSINTF
ncbi:MAG: amino acid transporter [Spirochaetes bacterium]|nr:amino acid transporter [Spirochaetota bacterium]